MCNMLIRTFRLTDKFSNALLKMAIYAAGFLLGRIYGFRRAVTTTFAAIVLTLVGALVGVVLLLRRVYGTATRQSSAVITERQQRLRRAMVQRSERALAEQQQGGVIEDPLVARNRSLSAITVILLVVLVAFLISSPNSGNTFGTGGGIIPPAPANDDNPNPVIPTPTTTTTPPNPLLSNVSGTLVFSVRQNGQEDIWALPVGSNLPVRMTDSPEDDRAPAWSPDGGKVAFASRRDGFWNLYILDLVEGATRQLTFGQDYVGAPAWSPDGAFLVYEGYTRQAGNIDLYIISADGQEGPIQFTRSPLPDTKPRWSPGGREIAYVGWRDTSPEILILSLDGQPEEEARRVTDTPTITENTPVWSPDGGRIAYTAIVDGIEGIYVKSLSTTEPARLIGRGRMPAWNPVDGSSVFYTVAQGEGSALYLAQVDSFGVGANAVAFQGLVADLDWTPSPHSLSGFDPRTPPLFEEQVSQLAGGKVNLALLNNINAPDPLLSDSVNDSFEAMRRRVVTKVGYDILSSVESVFWRRERPPEPGQDRRSWHYTGRAFALNRELAFTGNPTPLVILREDSELGTAWRVMARVAENAQNGELGEPLRVLPWDFAARSTDPVAFGEGGKLMSSIPAGYYVDLTQLFADFGWERVFSDRTWRTNFSGVLFWQFQKQSGLTWEQAMLQIYTDGELEEFLRGAEAIPATPLPTATPAEPTAIPGGNRPRTATPIPPDVP